jgi:hypothetical protein
MTLNMLRASRLNPTLSAEAQLNGIFDFNRTPLAPPGTSVIIHEKPSVRQFWGHTACMDGTLDRPVSITAATRSTPTRQPMPELPTPYIFFPEAVAMPKTFSADAAIQHAAQKLSYALLNPHPAAPFGTIGKPQLEAIQQLANIYATLTSNPITKQEPLRVIIPAPPRVVQTNNSHHHNEPNIIQPDEPHCTIPPSHNTGPVRIRPGRSTPNHIPLIPQPIANLAPHCYSTRSQTQCNEATPNLDNRFANSVIDMATAKSCKYRHLVSGNVTGHNKEVWETS